MSVIYDRHEAGRRMGEANAAHQHCIDGAHSPTYNIWRGMKKRCHNITDRSYFRYGARGISVCDRWLNSFAAFLEDMGERPIGRSIERRNNCGNYEPNNCYWATLEQQGRNKRNNRRHAFNGAMLTVEEIREIIPTDVSHGTLVSRLKDGWSVARAFSTPARKIIRCQ